MPAVDEKVLLRCPTCKHEWLAAMIRVGYDEHSAQTITEQCYCPSCEQKPPMIVVGQQPSLLP